MRVKQLTVLSGHELAMLVAALGEWRRHNQYEHNSNTQPADIGLPLGGKYQPLSELQLRRVENELSAGLDNKRARKIVGDVERLCTCEHISACSRNPAGQSLPCRKFLALKSHIQDLSKKLRDNRKLVLFTGQQLAQMVAVLQLWRIIAENSEVAHDEPAEIGVPLAKGQRPMTSRQIGIFQRRLCNASEDEGMRAIHLDLARMGACSQEECPNSAQNRDRPCRSFVAVKSKADSLMNLMNGE